MTNKQIEHLISNWENARLDPVACVKTGDNLVKLVKELQLKLKLLVEENLELYSELNQSGGN